jgi:hypothetical protein
MTRTAELLPSYNMDKTMHTEKILLMTTIMANKLEYITANIVSALFVWQMGFMNIVDGQVTTAQLIEIIIAVFVGLSVVFWNVARGIQALRDKK